MICEPQWQSVGKESDQGQCSHTLNKINKHVMHRHTLIMWPIASEQTLSNATPQCVGIPLTFYHVILWCLEIVLVVNAMEGSKQDHDWAMAMPRWCIVSERSVYIIHCLGVGWIMGGCIHFCTVPTTPNEAPDWTTTTITHTTTTDHCP